MKMSMVCRNSKAEDRSLRLSSGLRGQDIDGEKVSREASICVYGTTA